MIVVIMAMETYVFTISQINSQRQELRTNIGRVAKQIASIRLAETQGWYVYQDWIDNILNSDFGKDLVYIAVINEKDSLVAFSLNAKWLDLAGGIFLNRAEQADIVMRLSAGQVAKESRRDFDHQVVAIRWGAESLGKVDVGFSLIEFNNAIRRRLFINLALLGVRANMKTLTSFSRISWEGYWRFYTLGLMRSFPNALINKDSLAAARDYLRTGGSNQFDLGLTFALSMLDQLHGDRQAAEFELKAIGAPPEKAWQVCGPFKITHGFHERFWPEEVRAAELLNKRGEAMNWSRSPDEIRDGYLDLRVTLGGALNSAVYAQLRLNSPTSRSLQLRFGANKPMKVWLNDDLVLTKNVQHAAVMDETIALVHLRAGTNFLLVKLNVLAGEAGFYFRATNEAGRGIPDITFGDEPLAKAGGRPYFFAD